MKFSRKKAVFNWSGGKDSAFALQKVLMDDEFEVIALLTTINQEDECSTIHAIPLELIKEQASSIGIDLYPIFLPKAAKEYEHKMKEAVCHFKEKGVKHFIFGDLYLEDIKSYREKQLNPHGIEIVEPLWGKSADEIMEAFLNSGIKSKIVTTQADLLDASYIGKELNRELINSFPKNIDICGENGEYHTFSFDGELFKYEIDFEIESTQKLHYNFKLETGEMKSFEYWQAKFCN